MDEAMGGGAKTLLQKEVWVMVTREDNGVAGPSAHPHSPPLERQLTMTIQKLQQAGGGEDLGIRLTDDSDPYFLYTLLLSMEEFSQLKVNQNLKVEFSAFPSNLVQLVDKCGRRSADETYVLELSTPASDASCAVLSVVETNPFKNLVHLSLKFRPATDCTIKKHLAGCLTVKKAELVQLEDELTETRRDLTARLEMATSEASAAASEAAELRAEIATISTRLKSEHATELAEVQRKALEEQATAQEERRRASQDAEGAAAAAAAELRENIAKLTASDSAKAAQLIELEGSLRDTRARLAAAESSASASSKELNEARSEIRELHAAAHESEKALNESRIRIAELAQEVKGKAELEAQQAALTQAATQQKLTAESSAHQLEARCSDAEKRSQRYAREIQKGNAIITRLQRDLASVHAKLDARSSVIVSQEQAIGGHEKERVRLQRELAAAQDAKTTLQLSVEQEALRSTKLQEQLTEVQSALQKANSVINWLQKELTEAKRGRVIEGAIKRTSGRVPLGAKSTNVEQSRRVEYTRGQSAPISDKYLQHMEPAKHSLIPRAASSVPPSSENPKSG